MKFSLPAEATLLLIGTIIGVGMFGLPYVFGQAGFLTGAIELLILAAVITVVHLAYGEVVLATRRNHHLPGYTKQYLGSTLGWATRFTHLVGIAGSLLAYMVLGGFFASQLLARFIPHFPDVIGALAFYLLGTAVIFRNIRFESFTNALLTLGLIGAILVVVLNLLPSVDVSALGRLDPMSGFRPYGIILFALAGASVIPDMRRLLGARHRDALPTAIIAGTLIPAVLYLLFAFVVVGAVGTLTTPDAISGLAARFGSGYLVWGSIIGFLAALTSFIPLGLALEAMFVADFGAERRTASLMVALLPLGLYVLNFHDFITIISIIGAGAIGFESIVILLLYNEVLSRNRGKVLSGFQLPWAVRAVATILFAVGMIREIIRFF